MRCASIVRSMPWKGITTRGSLGAISNARRVLSSSTDMAQIQSFMKQHPHIKTIDCLLSDSCGIVRGKRVHASDLNTIIGEGFRIPSSVFSMDSLGEIVYGTGIVFENGEADKFCEGLPETLAVSPWKKDSGQIICRMVDDDRTPYFADPRNVLTRVLGMFDELGLRPVVAAELEFYLFDRERQRDGSIQPPRSPMTGKRVEAVQVYHIDRLREFDGFLQDVYDTCHLQGIATDTGVPESGPAQFEINTLHGSADVVADQAVMFKHAVRNVASSHGLQASFMAKPYGMRSGSGLHIHISVEDKATGKNIFDNGSDFNGTEKFRSAIGGMIHTMPESMLAFAPNANSYKRFKEGGNNFLPAAANWGYNNRTTALRIPPGPSAATRVEHRVAGADANVYLVLASVLAGVHHGITKQVTAPNPLEGNAYQTDEPQTKLPLDWMQAIQSFESGTTIRHYFGEDFSRLYAQIRRGERAKFNAVVTAQEQQWYSVL